jgi:hypothetical protein
MTISNKERLTKAELSWFFNFSDADCGIKSNFQTMVNLALFGIPTTFNDPYNSFILTSIARKRQIEKYYYSIHIDYRVALRATYDDIRLPVYIVSIFNKLAGIACFISDIDKLEKICGNIKLGIATDKEKLLISEIRINAVRLFNDAIDAYVGVHNGKLREMI